MNSEEEVAKAIFGDIDPELCKAFCPGCYKPIELQVLAGGRVRWVAPNHSSEEIEYTMCTVDLSYQKNPTHGQHLAHAYQVGNSPQTCFGCGKQIESVHIPGEGQLWCNAASYGDDNKYTCVQVSAMPIFHTHRKRREAIFEAYQQILVRSEKYMRDQDRQQKAEKREQDEGKEVLRALGDLIEAMGNIADNMKSSGTKFVFNHVFDETSSRFQEFAKRIQDLKPEDFPTVQALVDDPWAETLMDKIKGINKEVEEIGKGVTSLITTGRLPDESTVSGKELHPTHYNVHSSGIECIEIIATMPTALGTAVKHLHRAGLKGGASYNQDLGKAINYTKFAIQYLDEPVLYCRFSQDQELVSKYLLGFPSGLIRAALTLLLCHDENLEFRNGSFEDVVQLLTAALKDESEEF